MDEKNLTFVDVARSYNMGRVHGLMELGISVDKISEKLQMNEKIVELYMLSKDRIDKAMKGDQNE